MLDSKMRVAFGVALSVVLAALTACANGDGPLGLGHLLLHPAARHLLITRDNATLHSLAIGRTLGPAADGFVVSSSTGSVHVRWPRARLDVTRLAAEHGALGFDVYKVVWTSDGLDSLEDRLNLTGAHWYGGSEVLAQRWPLERQSARSQPYVTENQFELQYGGIQERLWLSSRRVALLVPPPVPLWVELNHNASGELGLKARYYDSVYQDFQPVANATLPSLEYYVVVSTQPDDTTWLFNRRVVSHFFGSPVAQPAPELLVRPIWSTWARYKKDINESIVWQFASQIRANNFSIAQLEIDDAWATHYGDLVFDPIKFPDPKNLTASLRSLLSINTTTLWTHPFVDLDSDTYKDTSNHEYFVHDSDGEVLVRHWWDGRGASIDATNPRAADWYVRRLRELLNSSGVVSYKFDAGEVHWLGRRMAYTQGTHPNYYSTSYAQLGSRLGDRVECRVATGTQQLPSLVRLMDRASRWGTDNGLQSVVTATLTASTLGYSFLLPDMIGGNAYAGRLPDRELYIRWVQASALLPAVQFSIAPWDYDDQVVSISRQYMDEWTGLRGRFSSYLAAAAASSVSHGVPIINPIHMWDDTEPALINSHQFAVGPIVMVAPVLRPGVTAVDVYLPHWNRANTTADVWLNTLDNELRRAGQTIRQSVGIGDLPLYVAAVAPDHPALTPHIRRLLLPFTDSDIADAR